MKKAQFMKKLSDTSNQHFMKKAQFMKKLSETEADLIKNVAYKKNACIRTIRYLCKKLLNLYCKDSILFGIFQVT